MTKNVDNGSLARKVSKEEKLSGTKIRGHSCGILTKNLASFCPYSKNFSEIEF